MDSNLRCNDLKCRTPLNNQAVVTTCSHIFCLPCADRLELTVPKDGQRKCPACSTYLLNPDDAVVTALNPSEDYKTSILSGLSPTIIMECSSRGLQFWSYQMAQEATYQEYLARSLQEKYSMLGAHLDNVVREANEENAKLIARIEAKDAHEQSLIERLQQLEHQFKEKDKTLKKVDALYRKLKEQKLAAGIEHAAEQDADQVLQGPQHHSTQARVTDRVRDRRGSNGSAHSNERRRMTLDPSAQYFAPPPSGQVSRPMGSSYTTANVAPSGQRRQLPQPLLGAYNQSLREGAPHNENLRRSTPLRTTQNFGRSGGSVTNFGMSANARSGRLPVPTLSHGLGAMGAGRQSYGY